jgi:hypothetical protein
MTKKHPWLACPNEECGPLLDQPCTASSKDYLQVYLIPISPRTSGFVLLNCIFCGYQEKREFSAELADIARRQQPKKRWERS